MKRSIDIFHTKHPSDFAFTDLETLQEVYGITEITAEDVAENYAHVASFEVSQDDWDEHCEVVADIGDIEDDYAVCEHVFFLMNYPLSDFKDKHVSQQHIKDERSHTTTSVGDIVRVDDEYYYCDGIGFVHLEISGLRNEEAA